MLEDVVTLWLNRLIGREEGASLLNETFGPQRLWPWERAFDSATPAQQARSPDREKLKL